MITDAERKQIENDRRRPHDYEDQIDYKWKHGKHYKMFAYVQAMTPEQHQMMQALHVMCYEAYSQWEQFRANIGVAYMEGDDEAANYWYRMADRMYDVWLATERLKLVV